MAGILFPRLISGFVETLERSSASVIRIDPVTKQRPSRMRVTTPDRSNDYVVFLWTITPGGPSPPRPAGEMRIQITNVTGFPLLAGVRTIVGGYSVDHNVYAFWDARRHVFFTQGSPSLQVDQRTLEDASHRGVATQLRPTREGQEVVVVVAPDSLLWYVQQGEPLHNAEGIAAGVAELVTATPEVEREFLDADTTEAGAARRYDLVQIMRAYREARFRPEVLRAYGYRCAICQTALKLVDAAHIIPVAHQGSTDEVDNGLALCRLHHAAYDNSLLGVRSDLSIVTNPAMVMKLQSLRLIAGWEEFRARLPHSITPPSHPDNRPRPEYLVTGLRARRWADDLIG